MDIDCKGVEPVLAVSSIGVAETGVAVNIELSDDVGEVASICKRILLSTRTI